MPIVKDKSSGFEFGSWGQFVAEMAKLVKNGPYVEIVPVKQPLIDRIYDKLSIWFDILIGIISVGVKYIFVIPVAILMIPLAFLFGIFRAVDELLDHD